MRDDNTFVSPIFHIYIFTQTLRLGGGRHFQSIHDVIPLTQPINLCEERRGRGRGVFGFFTSATNYVSVGVGDSEVNGFIVPASVTFFFQSSVNTHSMRVKKSKVSNADKA